MSINDIKSKIEIHCNRGIIICVFIVVAVFASYWQFTKNEFISFDDDIYMTDNIHVQEGINYKSLKWAVTTFHAFNWHPFTWLSHILDFQLFGLNASYHHFVSLFIHIINSILLFLLLKIMSKDIWPSAMVSILFALHPLHVESVAWISERKDLLSTFFMFMTIVLYYRYSKKQNITRYCLVCLFFMLGLMSKPMIVTLPFLLLLFDHWPIQRMKTRADKKDVNSINKKPVGFLLLEKTPLFILSAISSIITIIAQKQGGVVKSFHEFPIHIRFANAFISYILYIWKMIIPINLSFFYPYRDDLSIWLVVGAISVIMSISYYAIKSRHEDQFLFVGWFWYIGTLIPVIGIVQVATQSMADRYTYIPLVGLFIIISWVVQKYIKKISWLFRIIMVKLFIIITILMIMTWKQLGYWKNDIQLFSHAVEVTKDNPRSNYNLGIALEKKGKINEAIYYYKEAIRIKPDFLRARNSLGNILTRLGRYEEALPLYMQSLKLKRKYADGYFNVAFVLMKLNRIDEAIMQYEKAIEIDKKHVDSYYNLGLIFLGKKRYKEALKYFESVVEINPQDAEALNTIGNCLIRLGNIEKAIVYYKKSLFVNPDYETAKKNLNIAKKLLAN